VAIVNIELPAGLAAIRLPLVRGSGRYATVVREIASDLLATAFDFS
jgi:hypothetical protein